MGESENHSESGCCARPGGGASRPASASTICISCVAAQAMYRLSNGIDDGRTGDPCTSVLAATVDGIGAGHSASIVVAQSMSLRTVAATDERARAADRLQFTTGTGPIIDALARAAVVRHGELGTDGRWPEFGPAARDRLGVHAVMSVPLGLLGLDDLSAALTVYAADSGALGEEAARVIEMFAGHCALAASAELSRMRAEHLRVALHSNREIGAAMGVLMARHGYTREQAFDALRRVSQNANRKLAEIATEVADTGWLDAEVPTVPPRRAS